MVSGSCYEIVTYLGERSIIVWGRCITFIEQMSAPSFYFAPFFIIFIDGHCEYLCLQRSHATMDSCAHQRIYSSRSNTFGGLGICNRTIQGWLCHANLSLRIDSCVMFHFSLEKPKGLHVILWKGLLICRVPLSQLTSGINEQCFKDHWEYRSSCIWHEDATTRCCMMRRLLQQIMYVAF